MNVLAHMGDFEVEMHCNCRIFPIVVVFLMLFTAIFGIISTADEEITQEIKTRAGNITLYVGGSGPGNYTDIQEAIDDASAGDTVFVYSGSYTHTIIISKSINLVGENRNNTTLNGLSNNVRIIEITSWNVSISGFRIIDAGWGSRTCAIYLDNVQYCNIYNNNLSENNDYGLYLFRSENITISDNIIASNYEHGIFTSYSKNNVINKNVIERNKRYGIWVDYSSKNNISNNIISENEEDGIYTRSSNYNEIINNDVRSNHGVGIYLSSSSYNNVSSNTIAENLNGIHLSSANYNSIRNNDVRSYRNDAIRLTGSKYNSISNNNLFDSDCCINLDTSSNNDITDNFASNNSDGFCIDSSKNNNIYRNLFFNDGLYIMGNELSHFNTHNITKDNLVNGKSVYYYSNINDIVVDSISAGQIFVMNCSNFELNNLHINNTIVGIEIRFSMNVTLENCNLSSNTWDGISVKESSNIVIKNNDFWKNEAGIFIESSSNINISNNSILENDVGLLITSSSSEINISYNDLSFNDYGIYSYFSNTNSIIGNNFSNNENAITFEKISNYNINNNNISNCQNGLEMDESLNNNIFENKISNCEMGIILKFDSDNNYISNNNFINNGIAIDVWDSEENNITNNEFSNCGIFIEGSILSHYKTHTITTDNLVNGKPIYYLKDIDDTKIENIAVGQIFIVDCSEIQLNNLMIEKTTNAMQIHFSSKITISNSEFSQISYYGTFCTNSNSIEIRDSIFSSIHRKHIYFYQVMDGNISNNNLLYNSYNGGIELYESSKITINGNTISRGYLAIYLYNSNLNNIINNTISNIMRNGIYFRAASNNNIFNNTISFNNESGIFLKDSSNDNLIQGNTVSSNNGSGISIEATYGDESSINNIITNNVILLNQEHGIHIDTASNAYIINNQIYQNKNKGISIGSTNYDFLFDEITITGNDIRSNNGDGIFIDDVTNCIIADNSVLNNNKTGMYISPSVLGFNISSNLVSQNNGFGINIGSSEYYNSPAAIRNLNNNTISFNNLSGLNIENVIISNITNNNISSNNGVAIILYDSYDICIRNNKIESSDIGIGIFWAGNNEIINNQILDNRLGLECRFGTFNNLIMDNTFFDNEIGIKLNETKNTEILYNNISNNDYGIFSSNDYINEKFGEVSNFCLNNNSIIGNMVLKNDVGIFLNQSFDYQIFHNNFINNVLQADGDKYTPYWNETYPVCGNYWSDHSGVDLFSGPGQDVSGSDGVSDDIYSINLACLDHYPLLKPVIKSIPLSPQNPHALQKYTGIELTWEVPLFDGGSPIISYKIYRSTTSGAQTFYREVGNFLTFNDTKVSSGISYYFKISAINSHGESELSDEVFATPYDSDNDRIPDAWENDQGFDPYNPADANNDSDNDTLTNYEEYLNNTDCFNPDTDNDGLSDGDEVKVYLTDPTNPDTDGDNYYDGTEVDKDTDPLDSDDYPKPKKGSKPNFYIFLVVLVIVFIIIFLLFIISRFGKSKKKSTSDKKKLNRSKVIKKK